MQLRRIGRNRDLKKLLERLGVRGGGVEIMGQKDSLYRFYLSDIKTPALNILKQDALSVGAELAVPSGVITCEKPNFDAILLGTKRQLIALAKKSKQQPFGLKLLSQKLLPHLTHYQFEPKIMGVLNCNDDSFYKLSRVDAASFEHTVEQMIAQGAEIIDIGAASSRPGSTPPGPKEELSRIAPLCDIISQSKLYQRALFSVDSYEPEVVEYALKSGFSIINDITGASNPKLAELALKYNATYIVMHMQGRPQTMQENPHYEDVVGQLDAFFAERIARLEAAGLSKEAIWLDVGIGFGKRLEDNLDLISDLSHFAHFGCQLLVGASRKSLIDSLSPSEPSQRLPGTLAIHLEALQAGASILRVHDVAEHAQAMAVYEALRR